MLELIFQGFMEWAYSLTLECWQYFSSALLDIMSLDFAYLKTHVPVIGDIMQILLAVGWALLIGNLVFQALKSMASGLGFEGEDPKILFARTFVFAFLLLASPQICEIGLNLTSNIIDLLEIPDAVNVALVDESVFGALTAAWLLVIIFDIIIMFKVFGLILEIAERYVILAMLTITAPLAFSMGGSKNTSEIFTGWCRMFGSMCLLMVTNVIFFKMLLSVVSTVPSGLDVLPWMVLIMAIVKVAKKADAIITRIGLNPAITGDRLGGHGLPGMLTYAVVRTMAQQVVKSAGKSVGGSKGRGGQATPRGGGPTGPRTGPAAGGAHFSGTAGTASRSAGAAQSNQQTNTAQTSTAKSSQTQGGATVQFGGQQTDARQQTTSGVTGQSTVSSAFRNSTTRRSSVAAGSRRGTSFVRGTQSGATGSKTPGAGPRATWVQSHDGTAGTGRTPDVERTSDATAGMRIGVAGTGSPKSGVTGLRTGVVSGDGAAGTAPAQSSRFTSVTTQRVSGGRVDSRVTASEQNSISVGQPGQARSGPGAAEQSKHTERRQSPAAQGKSAAAGAPGVTRYTSRPDAPPARSGAVAAAPSGQSAASITTTGAKTAPARPTPGAAVPAGEVRQTSGGERHGRNGRQTGSGSYTEGHTPTARQERPVSGTRAAPRAASPATRTGMAGMASLTDKGGQARQTSRNQAAGSKSTPTGTGALGGKKTASTATAQQLKGRSSTRRNDRRPRNGGAKDGK